MPQVIRIKAGQVEFEAELNDSETAKAIADALPMRAKALRWGGEIYFDIGLECELEQGSRDVMAAGELGYWPTGTAFCIFFGPTPASRRKDEIRAASAVNIIGKVKGELAALWDVPDGADIMIERA
jgi:hypothetical protein